jgi:dephospho-CoA kinase
MIKVGLTGARFAGKDKVARYFSKIGVPVFNADIVLKYLINYKPSIEFKIREVLGEDKFKTLKRSSCFIEPDKVSDEDFKKIFDVCDFDIWKAYERYHDRHTKHIYTVFHSSYIFDMNIQNRLDKIINVYTTDTERAWRGTACMDISLPKASQLIENEQNQFTINSKCDFTIQNGDFDEEYTISSRVNKIDQQILDKHFKDQREERINESLDLYENVYLKLATESYENLSEALKYLQDRLSGLYRETWIKDPKFKDDFLKKENLLKEAIELLT